MEQQSSFVRLASKAGVTVALHLKVALFEERRSWLLRFMRVPKISEYQRVRCIWETSIIFPACACRAVEQVTQLFKCSVLLFMAQFSVQTICCSFNKKLHVLFDACEY